MSRLDDAIESVIDGAGGAPGCVVADGGSGARLGAAHRVPYFTQEYPEAVAAASAQLFWGKTVRHVEDLISVSVGNRGPLLEEIQMTTRNPIHFMTVRPSHSEAAAVRIPGDETPPRTGWPARRRSVLATEPILDGLAE